MLLKAAKLIYIYWDLVLMNLINVHFLLEQEIIIKKIFFVSYVYCGLVYDWEESRQERNRDTGFADRVCVYNHKCPAVLLCLAREIRAAIHVINYLNILSLITATNLPLTWSRKCSFYHSTALNSGRNCI